MPCRPSRRFVAVMVVAVALAVVGAATYYLVLSRIPPFNAELRQVGSGRTYIYDNVTSPYVNLSLTFTSPSSLDPVYLVISLVCSSTCPGYGSVIAPNATSLDLRYEDNTYPHWVVTRNGNYWSGSNAEATNPDGAVVGGTPPSFPNLETSVQSGAILTIVFPNENFYAATFDAIVLTYEGHPGSARVTLI